jgi:hypothetical protein
LPPVQVLMRLHLSLLLSPAVAACLLLREPKVTAYNMCWAGAVLGRSFGLTSGKPSWADSTGHPLPMPCRVSNFSSAYPVQEPLVMVPSVYQAPAVLLEFLPEPVHTLL